MEKEPNDIDTLIAKWLSGELTYEQKHQLETWMTHPDNAAEAAKLKTIWELTSHAELPSGESFESRWAKLEERMHSRRKLSWPIYKIAASLTLFLIVSASVMVWIRGGEKTVFTQNAEVKNLLLPDNSTVTLNAASTIRYNYRTWFFSRKVRLEGEAFFNVSHNGDAFVVETLLADTKVLGTSFNVRERVDKLTVSCLTGKVGVTAHTDYKSSVVLEKGDQCNITSGRVARTTFNIADASPIAWTIGKLRFEQTPLNEVFDEVIRFYNVKINYSLSTTITFTGTFENTSPEEVLKIVCLAAGLHYSIEAQNVFLISK